MTILHRRAGLTRPGCGGPARRWWLGVGATTTGCPGRRLRGRRRGARRRAAPATGWGTARRPPGRAWGGGVRAARAVAAAPPGAGGPDRDHRGPVRREADAARAVARSMSPCIVTQWNAAGLPLTCRSRTGKSGPARAEPGQRAAVGQLRPARSARRPFPRRPAPRIPRRAERKGDADRLLAPGAERVVALAGLPLVEAVGVRAERGRPSAAGPCCRRWRSRAVAAGLPSPSRRPAPRGPPAALAVAPVGHDHRAGDDLRPLLLRPAHRLQEAVRLVRLPVGEEQLGLGGQAWTTSPHRMPCWLSRASRLPSSRKDLTFTSAGRPCPGGAVAAEARVEDGDLDAPAAVPGRVPAGHPQQPQVVAAPTARLGHPGTGLRPAGGAGRGRRRGPGEGGQQGKARRG